MHPVILHRPQAQRSKFDPTEDRLLFDAVRMFGVANWNRISDSVPGRTARQCRERWNNYVNPVLFNGEWTESEDRMLCSKHEELGPRWVVIARFFPGRSKNNVRNRYLQLQRREHNTLPVKTAADDHRRNDAKGNDPFAFLDVVRDEGVKWKSSGIDENGRTEFFD
jgi:hypothetical protein